MSFTLDDEDKLAVHFQRTVTKSFTVMLVTALHTSFVYSEKLIFSPV